MNQTVVGIFNDQDDARRAVEQLVANGFSNDSVDLTNASRSERTSTRTDKDDDDDTFGEKVSRFFSSLFSDEDESKRYTNVGRNRPIVTVIANDETQATRASEILDSCGAIDVDDEQYGSEYETSETGTFASTSPERPDVADIDTPIGKTDRNIFDEDDIDTNKTIPVIREEMHVSKREVENGGVRIRSRIIERPVEETVRLREERVWVDRQAVDRAATDRDLDTFKEGEIEIKQRSEVPVVNKETRVVEELRVNREVGERDEVVRDTVRSAEVDVNETEASETVLKDKRRRRDSDSDLV